METVRLYYQDAHLREFSAHVVSCEPEKDHWAVVLDQTAFYPEGGWGAAPRTTSVPVRLSI